MAMVLSAYSNSIFKLTDELTASAGVNAQFFTLNSNWTIEPRLTLKWNFSPKTTYFEVSAPKMHNQCLRHTIGNLVSVDGVLFLVFFPRSVRLHG